MYSSKQIADWILSKLDTQAGDTISPLKLQKLLYYCQAWHLTIFGRALFDEKIEAWAHGPVIPSQYTRFAFMFRNDQIKINKINIDKPDLEPETEALLNEVISVYGEHSASYLESLTHTETPWILARNGKGEWERSSEEISHESMIKHFSALKSDGE
jgi:uncharacterized phage-associated protein